MVITRDFNASTAKQNEAVDALLNCGFYPSNIRLNNIDVEMQYNYKDILHEDFELVIRVYPSGQYKVIDYDEVRGVYNLEQVIEYFKQGIAYGYWFEFMTKSDYKQIVHGSLKELLMSIYKKFEDNGYKGQYSISENFLRINIDNPEDDREIWVYITYNPEKTYYEICVDHRIYFSRFNFDGILSDLKEVIKSNIDAEEENKTMNNVMTMSDAVAMVLSDDYKERLIAEYVEAKIRYERLHNTIIKWCAGKADFVTDIELLEEQAKHMGNYLKMLEIRAVKEDIELPAVDWRK